jgi:hypothetical protein
MWSIKYDKCLKCGTTNAKHVAQGLCKNAIRIKLKLSMEIMRDLRGMCQRLS